MRGDVPVVQDEGDPRVCAEAGYGSGLILRRDSEGGDVEALHVRHDASSGASGDLVGGGRNGTAIEDDETSGNLGRGCERGGGGRRRGDLGEADGRVRETEQDTDEAR